MKRCDNAWLDFATVDLNSAGKLLEDESLTQSGIPEVSTVQHFYQQAETILEQAWKQIQPV